MILEPKQEKYKCQNKDCNETESELYWDKDNKRWLCRKCHEEQKK